MGPTKIIRALGRVIDFIGRKIVWLSALSVLAIFVVVVVDVVGRYFFNHPIKGSNDIGEMILVCIAYFAMAFTQLNREHVRVTLVWSKLPPRGRVIGDALSFLFGAVVWVLIAWNLASRTWKLIAGTYASSSETAVLQISHIPFLVVAVLGAAAFTLVLLADSVRSWVQVVTGHIDTPAGGPRSGSGDGPPGKTGDSSDGDPATEVAIDP